MVSFERETIVERGKAGTEAAKANGKRAERPRNEKRLSDDPPPSGWWIDRDPGCRPPEMLPAGGLSGACQDGMIRYLPVWKTISDGTLAMLDHESRDRLAGMIESYLDEKSTAFKFDEEITQLADQTEDETVRHVVHALWYHYDDCVDHTVVLSKEEWNYFQRLLLLLRSDAELSIEHRRHWSWRQAVASLTLLCFLLAAMSLGFGWHLFIVAIPFGIISITISETRRKPSNTEIERLATLVPFDSTAQMLTVRRSVVGFQKRRYPPPLAKKRIRSPFMDRVNAIETTVFWLILSPFVLLSQTLPSSEEKVTVVGS